nr:hypothetical protein [Cressdnaviricota sp.]
MNLWRIARPKIQDPCPNIKVGAGRICTGHYVPQHNTIVSDTSLTNEFVANCSPQDTRSLPQH